MDDYIFIIIALVLSVFGALSQQKKKREQEERRLLDDDSASTPQSAFDELFGDDLFMSREGEPNQVPPPVVRPVKEKKKQKQVHQEMKAPPRMEYKPMVRESLVKSEERKPRNSISLELEKLSREDEAKLTPKNLIRKDFSLRKAVIYTEIINRKY